MVDYTLSNKADADLDAIYVYSFQTFGEAQADAYAAEVISSLNNLANLPETGRRRDDIQPGLFSIPCARHVIFYTMEDDGIFVVRILHDAMDVPRHLTSDQ